MTSQLSETAKSIILYFQSPEESNIALGLILLKQQLKECTLSDIDFYNIVQSVPLDNNAEFLMIVRTYFPLLFSGMEKEVERREEAKKRHEAINGKKEKNRYQENGYTGKFNGFFSGKVLRVVIGETLKLSGFICSVTKRANSYKSITVQVKQAPRKYEKYYTAYWNKYKELCEDSTRNRGWTMYTVENEVVNYLKIEKMEIGKDVSHICQLFNYDNSDPQTDYFSVGHYFTIETEGIKFADTKPEKEKEVVVSKKAEKKPAPGTTKTDKDKEETRKEFETFETCNEESGHKFIFEVREKSVILKGDTYTYRENIKQFFGGVWNRALNGWVIKIEHLESLKSIFC